MVRREDLPMRRVLAIALLAASILLSPLATQIVHAATLPVQHATFVARVIELVNVERQRVGAPPLVANGALTRAAQTYAGVLTDGTCFSHTCGSTLVQRIDGSGYTGWSAAGENIALGQATPETVMAAWMGSAGHRGNILNSAYKEIGVGVAIKPNMAMVWVQDFGASTRPIVNTPAANCSPRPAFTVRSRPASAGILEVTVGASTTTGAPANTLRTVRFGSAVNGNIDITGYGQVASNTDVGIIPGTREVTFLVRRPAGGATTIPLILTDACGEWRTFAGAGPSIP
jgi:uncharacterized protein YkwD